MSFLKHLWPVLKWGMFLVVLLFVARHGYLLWVDDRWTAVDSRAADIHWGWLALAGGSSVVAWLPSVWYWRKLMLATGATPRWPQVFRSYYCGHLGKYVPGKAAAIVIRTALLKDSGVAASAAAFTATVEAVTYMWTGTLLAVLLYSSLAAYLPETIAAPLGNPLLRLVLVGLIVCLGLGGLIALTRSYERLVKMLGGQPPAARLAPRSAPARAIFSGVLVFLAAWWIQGLTLGLTMQAVSHDRIAWSEWPCWTATAAVAMVGGFIAIFTPGGLGVREGLLMELLTGQVGAHQAVLVAVLMRGVSLAGEILIAATLYYAVSGIPVNAGTLLVPPRRGS